MADHLTGIWNRIGSTRISWLRLAILVAVGACARAQTTHVSKSLTPPLMDRQKEIALALSSCPPSVADKAAVYVLESSGYVKVRESQNGFTASSNMRFPSARTRSAWMQKVPARSCHVT
jgi:hypothetical protein